MIDLPGAMRVLGIAERSGDDERIRQMQDYMLKAADEIERLNGREDEARFLLDYISGDSPVGRDVAKWMRGDAIFNTPAKEAE